VRTDDPLWSSFPLELEVIVGLLLIAILCVVVLALRRNARTTDPLGRARLNLLVDAPRWIGVIALMLGVFGFFLAFETHLVRVAIDHQTNWIDWERSHQRMSRFLSASALVCALGFLASWALAGWTERRRRS